MAGKTIISACALTVALSVCGNAYAGSAPARLSCTSKASSGAKVQLEGWMPAVEEVLDLKITQGNSTKRLTDGNSTYKTVVNFRRKVFALIISENDGVFDTTIYALPESMKVSGGPHRMQATFTAYLSAPKPGVKGTSVGLNDFHRDLPMTCKYLYEI